MGYAEIKITTHAIKGLAQKIEEEKMKEKLKDSKEKSKDKDEKESSLKVKSNLVINPEDEMEDGLTFYQRIFTNRDFLFITNLQKINIILSYSRSCPSNVKRQPILTDAEKERIDRENPGSYDGAINYGSKITNTGLYVQDIGVYLLICQ